MMEFDKKIKNMATKEMTKGIASEEVNVSRCQL
jgi:hypothetical protein